MPTTKQYRPDAKTIVKIIHKMLYPGTARRQVGLHVCASTEVQSRGSLNKEGSRESPVGGLEDKVALKLKLFRRAHVNLNALSKRFSWSLRGYLLSPYKTHRICMNPAIGQ